MKCIPYTHEEIRALDEVRAMAHIPPHDNVVRYYTSWIETRTALVYDVFMRVQQRGSSSVSSSTAASITTSFADTAQVLCIQMEFCSGTLRSWLAARTSVNAPHSMTVFHEIVCGLRHLHQHGLLHLDVKPENCLHDARGIFKLGDFGSCRAADDGRASETATDLIGTEIYSAPECSESPCRCSAKSDVFSLGLCLLELFAVFVTGSLGFPLVIRRGLLTEIRILLGMERAMAFASVRAGTLVTGWPKQILDLIVAMTMPRPDDRPDLDSILAWSSLALKPSPKVATVVEGQHRAGGDGDPDLVLI